jgi:adenylosuccinate synthase
VVGITKAYATRVGAGPFPTELHGETGERLRKAGGEYGATTGRPRRCGWLDLPALRMGARLSGMQSLALTKLDVLGGLGEVSVGVAYKLDGKELDEPPTDPATDARAAGLGGFPGWTLPSGPTSRISARAFLRRTIERWQVPFDLVSVGADRAETIRHDPFGK